MRMQRTHSMMMGGDEITCALSVDLLGAMGESKRRMSTMSTPVPVLRTFALFQSISRPGGPSIMNSLSHLPLSLPLLFCDDR